MRYRLLGRTGLRVSEMFLGTRSFGGQGRQGGHGGTATPPQECRRILDLYEESGGNVLDAPLNHRDGESERILGDLLRGRRDRFVLGAKFSAPRVPADPNSAGNHRKNLTLSLEAGLRRMGTDHFDVYWLQAWDRHTPIEETMRALDDAVRAGKILHVGVSDTPAWLVARANAVAEQRGWTPFAAIQAPYSLVERDIERELLPMAQELGLTVAVWAPLAYGVLSGKYTRPGGPGPGGGPEPGPGPGLGGGRVAPETLGAAQLATAWAVQEVADELGVLPSQVAIAWTRSRSRAVHPILRARNVDQVAEHLAALDVVLPEAALAKLEAATGFELGYPHDYVAQAEARAEAQGHGAG